MLKCISTIPILQTFMAPLVCLVEGLFLPTFSTTAFQNQHSKSTETETETESCECESPRASAFVSAKMARASGLWDSGTLPITWKGIHFRIQRNMCGTWMNIAFCWSPSRSAMQQSLLQGPARVRFKLEWAMICDKQ